MGRGRDVHRRMVFWTGMPLDAAGAALIVSGTSDRLMHGTGALGVLAGAVLAVRNHRV